MFKTAFSTVACPEWTLDRVARAAAEFGYDALELRTFGSGSSQIACDPALTAPEKVRRIMREAGVEVACLATGIALDAPIRPPVIGRVLGDNEKDVRRAKAAIDLAAQLECPLVRLFGFELGERERRTAGVARIRERLALVADAARHTGVRVAVENGGSFRRAGELRELIDGMGPQVGAAYSGAVAADAGEDPVHGLETLGDRVWAVKLKDVASDGRPAVVGEGRSKCRELVAALGGFRGVVVVEWDRMWIPGLDPAEVVLPRAARRLYEWSGRERLGAGVRAMA